MKKTVKKIQERIAALTDKLTEDQRRVITAIFQEVVDLWKEYQELVMQHGSCHRCGKENYDSWWIPDANWQVIPKQYWDKCLCFDCYLQEVVK